ncbi:MAG: 30S ribosomal protein S9 [Candidatus Levyibacteriota bacterium]
MTEEVQAKKEKKQAKKDFAFAVGRQKEAVARVRLYAHVKDGHMWGEQKVTKEQILVNSVPVEHYFPGPLAKKYYSKPFEVTSTVGKFAVTVRIIGGGKNGQLDAMVKGIARALCEVDKTKFRKLLKDKGFLSRDARVRERRKVGTGGKARRKKQSPKR